MSMGGVAFCIRAVQMNGQIINSSRVIFDNACFILFFLFCSLVVAVAVRNFSKAFEYVFRYGQFHYNEYAVPYEKMVFDVKGFYACSG